VAPPSSVMLLAPVLQGPAVSRPAKLCESFRAQSYPPPGTSSTWTPWTAVASGLLLASRAVSVWTNAVPSAVPL
ncbi:MAG: hypothetical protein ACK559_35955, partial [bacterium]